MAALSGRRPDTATEWIVHLALINEWVEAWFKWPRDTTAEVYKDLRNGVAGIAALRANEKCVRLGSPDKRLRLIGKLASARILLWSNADSRIPPLPVGHDVSAAVAMFKSDRPAIEHEASREVLPPIDTETIEKTSHFGALAPCQQDRLPEGRYINRADVVGGPR